MKTIATLIIALFFGITAQANTASKTVKVETLETSVVSEINIEENVTELTSEIARLYKRSNTRVKKELGFYTKANRAKMA
ncbi:hypothetical protein RQM65_14245 [Pricia sp. S334]|uniref:Uncharacterized protein n=1 Tax=Pricia mediterranea TaxID=3076079 RepID=A0ABU3L942_9FLAO|nr:hypothetical protein [Pricia sp. S334]MDT7829831.1 hypothetical protein [Pricia sp. S334]